MIDWKKLSKIDAHIHLMPPDVIDAYKDAGSLFARYGAIEDYMKIMDQYHIESSFIMPFNDPYMLSMDFKVETVHDSLSQLVSTDKTKFFAFADIDLRNNLNTTLKEIDKTLQNQNFLGIKIHPSNTGYPVDGEYYDEIFKYASLKNVLVEVHSYPREHIADDVCSPGRIKNVINKFPGLRLSIAHLGGFQYEELNDINAYFNLSAILPDFVNRYGIEKTNQILRRIGVEKLVFATDYPDSRSLKPDEIYDKYFDILQQMDFSLEEAKGICKDNALRMIGK